MAKIIKVGNVYVEIPDESPLAPTSSHDSSQPIRAEKPEHPDKHEPTPYIYRPNDPFQSSIDRIEALGNVHKVNKPWVRKAFIFFFLIFPFSLMEIVAVNALFVEPGGQKLKSFLMYNLTGLMLCGPYLLIWIGSGRSQSRTNPSDT